MRARGGAVAVVFGDGSAEVVDAECSAEPAPIPAWREPGALLGRALHFLRADVYADFAVAEDLLASDAEMFGASGKASVLDFKRARLTESINYDEIIIYDVDEDNRVVVAGFRCLIPGKEGRGTDFIELDAEGMIVRASAVRHAALVS